MSQVIPTAWCGVLLEKLTGLQLVRKFLAFHGTRRFITALTSVRHLSLSWASPIQSIYPHPTSWRSILILSTHLRLGLTSGLFPSGFPTKTLYTPLSSPIYATCPAHLILLYFITRKIRAKSTSIELPSCIKLAFTLFHYFLFSLQIRTQNSLLVSVRQCHISLSDNNRMFACMTIQNIQITLIPHENYSIHKCVLMGVP